MHERIKPRLISIELLYSVIIQVLIEIVGLSSLKQNW